MNARETRLFVCLSFGRRQLVTPTWTMGRRDDDVEEGADGGLNLLLLAVEEHEARLAGKPRTTAASVSVDARWAPRTPGGFKFEFDDDGANGGDDVVVRGRKRTMSTTTKKKETTTKRKRTTPSTVKENGGKKGRAVSVKTKTKKKSGTRGTEETAKPTRATLGEAEMAVAVEELAMEHPDLVIEKVREWTDVALDDVRARTAALNRSLKRVESALELHRQGEKGNDEGILKEDEAREREMGVIMLKEYERTLVLEREHLEETLNRWQAIRTKAEFEAAKLALRWLDASNRDSDDDEKDDVMANAVDDDQFDHCSSAYAFLRLAMGALMEQKTPIKPELAAKAHSPTGVLDMARLLTPPS
jgi:hypothetical protein